MKENAGGPKFLQIPNPVFEAVEIQKRVAKGHSVARIAKLFGESLRWVEVRLQLLELGDEVLAAARLSGRDRLTMGAVEEILKVPAELRPEAVQLVLHPQLALGVLDEDQARWTIYKSLLEPAARLDRWTRERRQTEDRWRKELEKWVGDGAEILSIQWSETAAINGRARRPKWVVDAKEPVPDELISPTAPKLKGRWLRWVHLAAKHGAPVVIVREEGGKGSRAIINLRPVIDAEKALAEHQPADVWLKTRRMKLSSISFSGSSPSNAPQGPWILDSLEGLRSPTYLRVGKFNGNEAGFTSTLTGHCHWQQVVNEKGEAAARLEGLPSQCPTPKTFSCEAQRTWLQTIRKERDWTWAEHVSGVNRRTWEGWEHRFRLPYGIAAHIHQQYHADR